MRPRDGGAGLQRAALERPAWPDPALDLYVYGHTHAPAIGRGERESVYANPGAWMDAPAFLRISDARIELARLDGDAVTVTATLERKDNPGAQRKL